MSKVKRNVGYDLIRIISIFMVVAIHSHVAPLGKNQGSGVWLAVMLMQTLCVVAVPLFFMVSGALLLSGDKAVGVSELFKKRLPKQAIPFVIWSLVYVAARVVMGKLDLSLSAITSLLYEPAYYQFWFMYTLLAIYLLLPLLQTLIKSCDRQRLEYILVLWFVFSIAVPLLSRYVPGFSISDHVGLVLCEGYIGYFILGHYLKKYKGDVKPSRGVLMWLGGAVGTGVCAAVEFFYSKNTGEAYTGFVYQAYLTPFVVLSCCGLFIFFGNQRFRLKGKVAALVTGVSALSVGVYYIHMIVLTFLEEVGFVGESNILVLEAKIIATYLVSLVGAFVISKIPVVRKILLGVN